MNVQLRDWLTLYSLLMKSNLKIRSAYRLNYVLSLVMQMFLSFSELAAVLLILVKVHTIGGWTANEVTFLFGLIVFSSGVYRIFASELHDFDKYLVNGEFDAVLTRPAPALLTLMAKSIDVEHLGRVLQGGIVLVFEYIRLGPSHGFHAITILEIIYAILCGAMIWFAMVITVATIGFWTTRIDDLQPVFLYGPQTATSYPLSIYPKAIQALFYSVMPVAFGAYVPAALILHKGLPESLWVVTGLVSVAAVLLAVGFWSLGIRRYTSTGT